MNKFDFLRAYRSPFVQPKMKFYIGKIKYGTPIFYPSRWVKSDEKGYKKVVPKKIGFDFVGLGYKTKWSDTDYRFEWAPIWSFVFFGIQFTVTWAVPEPYHYWEAWLYYRNNTTKDASEIYRLTECKEGFSLVYTSYSKDKVETVDYYSKILKKKYQ